MQAIKNILKQYWGYDTFRATQEEAILSVLAKKDTLVLLPTGGGKSVCFQVPALAQPGLCLVVSPLIALMKDQVMNLEKKGIKAAAVYTGMGYRQMDMLLDNCVYGNYKFLYISPERLATDEFRVRMEKMNINLLAVDEAHCVSQWGYDFRPPYLKIVEVREKLKNVPVIALTATATPKVAEDIQQKLGFAQTNVFQKSFVRQNLSYVVRQTMNKEQSLTEILSKVKGSAVVYVRNRKKTKEFSDHLNKHGVKADFYHAGLEPAIRSKKQDAWMQHKNAVMVCTNAFGMGIDKPDVRTVVHIDLADSVEAYFQEAGRAGRDEKKAYAVQLVAKADISGLEEKLKENFPSVDFIKKVYDALSSYLRIAFNSGIIETIGGMDFDIGDFAVKNGWKPAKVLGALKILQQQEFLYVTDGVYGQAQIKAVGNKDVIYEFQARHKAWEPLVKFILRSSEGVFEDYVPLDEQALAKRLKLSLEEITEQLNVLDKFRIFSYRPRKEKPQIIYLRNRVKAEDLRLDTAAIDERKTEYENRLKAVRNYVTENNICRSRLLVSYFGEEEVADCGICDVCVARKKSGLSPADFSKIVETLEGELKNGNLSFDQLNQRLKLNKADLYTVLDFLTDAGKVEKTAGNELIWRG